MSNLVSMSEVRIACDVQDGKRDAALDLLRGAVEADFESRTNRLFARRVEDVEERLLPCDERVPKLWSRVSRIQTAKIEERSLSDVDLAEVASTDYYVAPEASSITRFRGCWKEVVRLTITGGYTDEGKDDGDDATIICPADIKNAILTQIQFLQLRQAGPALAMSTQSFETSQTTYLAADMHPVFKQAVDRYRFIPV